MSNTDLTLSSWSPQFSKDRFAVRGEAQVLCWVCVNCAGCGGFWRWDTCLCFRRSRMVKSRPKGMEPSGQGELPIMAGILFAYSWMPRARHTVWNSMHSMSRSQIDEWANSKIILHFKTKSDKIISVRTRPFWPSPDRVVRFSKFSTTMSHVIFVIQLY